jgi:hypothetical protein
MKKFCAATIVSLLLLLTFGCSSTPSGTVAIKDLQQNAAAQLGQNVVVVGMAEMNTPNAPTRMFRIYRDNHYFWVSLPESASEPPQGADVRVSGTLQQKEFTLIGKVYYIQANKVGLE